ncbi:23S rRNA (pseudouridine(1915)-N(3))-methyltransferase RlmH [Chromatium okenii]|uniref:Ribosomal RNA large subunit methyltransferase H n=1 Tax=Chromatium okenii TaxID=61644 RepID=A0A2S7XQ16_9GAMM|nr:23S rRNA (pseudouridine(1915)-N(3))-methyltransferase RlmH [Chromatium okenii]MBV5309351.1 23S rRNA (pseudouridine(1915)-N(3))-methyltransferase RlmH [Chromatium okenii]PQJ95830.1 23S rRNA (pseudouridine(1915)-N(3))-methyltransferase RlmH [Chromatium okenii]
MRIHLLCVGQRMPDWVATGYSEYAKRLPPECTLKLVEIESVRRTKTTVAAQAREDEGRRILKAIPKGAGVIALDVAGQCWSTETLALQLKHWLAAGQDCALLIGGADGLAADCLSRAEQRWSLSALTFPHPLVRVIVAEQLYRAWTLLQGHPYHRG